MGEGVAWKDVCFAVGFPGFGSAGAAFACACIWPWGGLGYVT